jgi:hypothetical protein
MNLELTALEKALHGNNCTNLLFLGTKYSIVYIYRMSLHFRTYTINKMKINPQRIFIYIQLVEKSVGKIREGKKNQIIIPRLFPALSYLDKYFVKLSRLTCECRHGIVKNILDNAKCLMSTLSGQHLYVYYHL